MYNTEDTIFALATGTGNNAISVIRISGKHAYDISDNFIRLKKKIFLK